MDRRLLSLPLAAAMAFSLVAAEDGSTAVTSATAAVEGDAVTVTGEAVFVDVPQTVAEDPAGDVTVPAGYIFGLDEIAGSPAPTGLDITAASVARPDPFANDLRFTFDIADQLEAIGAVPTVATFQWDMVVGSFGAEVTLTARVGDQVSAVDAHLSDGPAPDNHVAAYFFVERCSPPDDTGTSTCQSRQVDGALEDGRLEWRISLADLGAQPGDVIGPTDYAPMGSTLQLGTVRMSDGFYDEVPVGVISDIRLPTPDVNVRYLDADGGVLAIRSAALGSDGRFSSTAEAPGATTARVTACYGSHNCHSVDVPVGG